TGSVEKHLPGALSSAMSGLGAKDGEGISVTVGGTSLSSSFRVYNTNITLANGEYRRAFMNARQRAVDGKVAATNLFKRKDLKPAQIASLQNSIRIFDAKIAIIDRTTNLIDNPPARQGVGDYVGTEWWKLGTYTTNWQMLNLRDPGRPSATEVSNAKSMGDNI